MSAPSRPRKRQHDSSPSESHGRKKLEGSSGRLREIANALVARFVVLRDQIADMPESEYRDAMVDTLNQWHNDLGLLQWKLSLSSIKSLHDRIDFSLRFPPNPSPAEHSDCNWPDVSEVNQQLQSIHQAWLDTIPSSDQDAPRLSPHRFGYRSAWHQEQKRCRDLLCLRPSTHIIRLPLSTHHPVFGRFSARVASQRDLPPSKNGYDTYAVAETLLEQMGDHFDCEKDRGSAFTRITTDVTSYACFPKGSWKYQQRVTANGMTAVPDWTFKGFKGTSNFPIILREDKNEPGNNGDAYMQLCRTYQVWAWRCQEMSGSGSNGAEAFLKMGCPMFLLSLVGPVLTVHGGFFDGKDCLVEPLSPPTPMLQDGPSSTARRLGLARVLDALICGVREIEDPLEGDKPDPDMARRGLPSIYDTCSPLGSDEGPEIKLKFKRRIESSTTDDRRPVFEAEWGTPAVTVHGENATKKVIVKLTDQRYGVAAHQYLASKGFAPTLLATSEREGAPTCYIMERLSPSKWVSLDELASQHKSFNGSTKAAIGKALLKILDVLESAKLVHGNLYPSNVMVKVRGREKKPYVENGSATVRLIAWDWSGKAGEVSYPHGRRANRGERSLALPWPIDRGLIDVKADRRFFQSWFDEL